MAKGTKESIEEIVEDWAKIQLMEAGTKYFTKTQSINPEIDDALKKAPSKNGGAGNNFPDIKLFIETKKFRKIPVMIEVKGAKGKICKFNDEGEIENKNKDGKPIYKNIVNYAVNGAVHYANAIVNCANSYKEAIAIGINGYNEGKNTIYEIRTYYISKDNYCVPKEIGPFSDLSFLFKNNQDKFIEKIDKTNLSPDELEVLSKQLENEIETKLQKLNQMMYHSLHVPVGLRVKLVSGMIMAALGVESKVSPLEISDLKGEMGTSSNDGVVLINKIDSFLAERKLPDEKKRMIIDDLRTAFIYSNLSSPINGESRLKTIYRSVKDDIMPIFTSTHHLDFTGKLFNVLNEWVDIPDDEKNDVILTPRYVTELMAKIAQVNKDSYVWDYAAGSAGFLISSMKLMIKDAEERIDSETELQNKIVKIKNEQLLGIEKRSDMYLLAVLNMILMGDGSCNIIQKDSLTEYTGKYEQGEFKGKDFPANVFLLNPPYSADGKGFVFVETALKRMKNGKAVVLIQENAGSGSGLPYTKRLLENNTLVASIHMAVDLFRGKSSVQTGIFVFDIGKPHDIRQMVKFIDFSNDGYTRQDKRTSSQEVNLRNTDNAIERYDELVNIVLFGKNYLHYLKEENYIEDTISLNGDDWMFSQHVKNSDLPTEDDFKDVVSEFLGWKINSVLKGIEKKTTEELHSYLTASDLDTFILTDVENESLKRYNSSSIKYKVFKLGTGEDRLFDISTSKSKLNANTLTFGGNFPYVARGSSNNGIRGYITADEKYLNPGNTISFGQDTATIFYQDKPYFTGDKIKVMAYRNRELTPELACFLITMMRKAFRLFSWGVTSFDMKVIKNVEISLPVDTNNKIDYEYIHNFIRAQEKILIENVFDWIKDYF